MHCEWVDGPFTISTDPERLDVDLIHGFLSQRAYWAQGRPTEVVQRSIARSLCFGVYEGRNQIGFARVVTDYAIFAGLFDVFILERIAGAACPSGCCAACLRILRWRACAGFICSPTMRMASTDNSGSLR